MVERGVDYGLGKLADVYWPEHAIAAGLLSARTIAQAAAETIAAAPTIADAPGR